MRIRERVKHYMPILVGIIYMIYFYTFLTFAHQNGWLISLKDVSFSNLGIALLIDCGSMLIFPLFIIMICKKKLNEWGFKKSKLAIVLVLIYVLFFILHKDYTINGIYKAFFYLFIVALPEEIIYRGYIYNSLKKSNRINAIIISGILFGIMHSILPSVISEFSISIMVKDMFNQVGGGILSSLIFILYLEKGDSIFIPILIHALLDYSYGVLGMLIAIIVLVYLLIINRKNKVTNKYFIEEGKLFEDNSQN